MADVFSKKKRSQVMGLIRGTGNRDTELRLVAIFRRHKIHGWRRRAELIGKPDFVFQRERLVIFVDGCFWHRCPVHGHVPRGNRKYWAQKFDRNSDRDREVNRLLRSKGWTVLRIWEHGLRQEARTLRKVDAALAQARLACRKARSRMK